jgi:hypothetical protein
MHILVILAQVAVTASVDVQHQRASHMADEIIPRTFCCRVATARRCCSNPRSVETHKHLSEPIMRRIRTLRYIALARLLAVAWRSSLANATKNWAWLLYRVRVMCLAHAHCCLQRLWCNRCCLSPTLPWLIVLNSVQSLFAGCAFFFRNCLRLFRVLSSSLALLDYYLLCLLHASLPVM